MNAKIEQKLQELVGLRIGILVGTSAKYYGTIVEVVDGTITLLTGYEPSKIESCYVDINSITSFWVYKEEKVDTNPRRNRQLRD